MPLAGDGSIPGGEKHGRRQAGAAAMKAPRSGKGRSPSRPVRRS